MKTIRDLRTSLRFSPHEINSTIKYFSKDANIDFNVWLESKRMNLQRDFVWNIDQKRELIWSVLMNRNIPRMAMMNILDNDSQSSGVYQVIDGKQRLSAMLDFYNNKYTLIIDHVEYLFKDLPTDYQRVIGGFNFAYYLANESIVGEFTDQDKIDWFKYINFAGTPQDNEHFEKLK